MSDTEKLQTIARLLHEAYKHYFERDNDGHKSDEAHITVHYGNFWDRASTIGMPITGIEIYSYVLGPNRHHYFDNLDQALTVVQQWHRQQIQDTKESCLYTELEDQRRHAMRAFNAQMDAMIQHDGFE